MKEKIKKLLLKKELYIILISFLLVLGIMCLVEFDVASDDGTFERLSESNFSEYTSLLYNEYNGRIVPNSIMYFLTRYDLIDVWRVLNALVIMALAYGINRLYKAKVGLKDYLIVLTLIGCIGIMVLSSAVFWFTGSVGYIWAITAGIFSLIPIADSFFRNKPYKVMSRQGIASILLGIFVMLSMEQMALIVIGFYVLHFLYSIFIKKEKLNFIRVIPIIIFIVFLLIHMLAPGVKERYDKGLIRWMDYREMPTVTLIKTWVAWTYEKVFYEHRLLLILLGFFTISTYKKNDLILKSFKIFLGLSIVSMFTFGSIPEGVFMGSNPYLSNVIDYININSISNFNNIIENGRNFISFIPFIFWSIYMALQVYIIFKSSKHKFFDIICLLAALATIIMMWISPSFIGSGNRVCIVFSVILIFIINNFRISHDIKTDAMYYSVPLLNISILVYVWLTHGYILFY